jgi:hypothetical protein
MNQSEYRGLVDFRENPDLRAGWQREYAKYIADRETTMGDIDQLPLPGPLSLKREDPSHRMLEGQEKIILTMGPLDQYPRLNEYKQAIERYVNAYDTTPFRGGCKPQSRRRRSRQRRRSSYRRRRGGGGAGGVKKRRTGRKMRGVRTKVIYVPQPMAAQQPQQLQQPQYVADQQPGVLGFAKAGFGLGIGNYVAGDVYEGAKGLFFGDE